jgi:hypothetical protein
MNKNWLLVFAFVCILLPFSLLSGCAMPVQADTVQSTVTVGILVFPDAYTFQPNSCVTFERGVQSATSSSEVPISWNHDSLGTAASQIAYVRPSADVGAGEVYFVFCNSSASSISIPSEASVMYQVLNPGPS